MAIINLTPHVIHLPNVSVEPSGVVARCVEESTPAGQFAGVDLIRRSYGEVTDLPDPEPDTLYVVSLLVRQALPDRKDLASPGDLIRGESGQIAGARNLVVNSF